MIRRLMRVEDEADARTVARLVGRHVEDTNLRGYAAVLPAFAAHDEHVLRAALERTRVRVMRGERGLALVGDTFALYQAGTELAGLDLASLQATGLWVRSAAEVLDGGPAAMSIGGRAFTWRAPVVMGVVNVTPDSFSDGGRFLEPERAVAQALSLAQAGAELLDVGGESTRPRGKAYGEGAATISVDEECARIVTVVRALRARSEVPISIDTRKAGVAREAIAAGASLVNDVSGLLHDPLLAKVVAESGAALCLMHTPHDIEELTHEEPSTDIVGDVLAGLAAAIARAEAGGVSQERLLLDPGIGFGKSPAHNLHLLRHVECVAALGRPVLIGASRKATIGLAAAAAGAAPRPAHERVAGSVGAAVAAWHRGAHVLRVHDVGETVEALRVAAAIRDAGDGGLG